VIFVGSCGNKKTAAAIVADGGVSSIKMGERKTTDKKSLVSVLE
jgi:hypothetical protein